MAIPDFQSTMLPLLEFAKDGKEHSFREAVDNLAIRFKLTDKELKELLPSGRAVTFDNRLAWAKFHLQKAKLLESPKRAFLRITKRGLETLKEKPERINLKYLEKFPEFVEFRNKTKSKDPKTVDKEQRDDEEHDTPEETLEKSFLKTRNRLAAELLTQIKEGSDKFFEKLVVELLVKMGYGGSIKDAGEAIGRSGDGGIDGIIKEDRLDIDTIAIQAKKWEGVVGRPELQKFAGALQGNRAKKGIFITTSSFSKQALEYVTIIDSKIVLLDGEQLTDLMIDYDLGVTKVASYDIKKIDSDYFVDE